MGAQKYVWKLSESNACREALTAEQANQIRDLYRDVYNRLNKEIARSRNRYHTDYLRELQKQIVAETLKVSEAAGVIIPRNMRGAAEQVLRETNALPQSLGMRVNMNYSAVATKIIGNVLQGRVYGSGWSLSGALWKDYQKSKQDINSVVARGIAQNKSALEIAGDLEKYVDPGAKKPWDWNKVYPGVKTQIDYNAQRLARTMVSHAYQQAIVEAGKANPFCEGFRWIAANSENRVCPVCMERDGRIFGKDEVPLDHPNGMCTLEIVILIDMAEAADRIADWTLGKSDPALDEWAAFLSQ